MTYGYKCVTSDPHNVDDRFVQGAVANNGLDFPPELQGLSGGILSSQLENYKGRRPMGMPGRNEPCPCGSGRKYKRCCADRVEGLTKAQAAPPERWAYASAAADADEPMQMARTA